MRAIRLFFVVVLAVMLIFLALANRDLVTVSLFPANMSHFVGGQWALTMPIFLALVLAMVVGLLIGLLWEWLREADIRAEAKARGKELARLEREVGDLRRTHAGPRDDVLAILDDSAARPATGANLPATR